MRLILSYFAVGMDGRGAPVSFPLEAESRQAAAQVLQDLAEAAVRAGEPAFKAFGAQHYTHNLVRSVSTARLHYLQDVAKERGHAGPASFVVQGCNYQHLAVNLLSVDEWFETVAQRAEVAFA